jgi:hypothetical protein
MSKNDILYRLRLLRSDPASARPRRLALWLVLLLFFQVALSPLIAFADSTIPSYWTETNIGNTSVAGSSSQASNVYTVRGNGSGIGGTWDKFYFLSQKVTGQISARARLTGSSRNGSAVGKYGVMIREDLTTWQASRMVSLSVDSNRNVHFQWRSTVGGNTGYVAGPTNVTLPIYLKITRRGNTFTGSYATGCFYDSCFTNISNATATIDMTVNVHEGLFVNSGDDSNLHTATFDNIDMRQEPVSLNINWGSNQSSPNAFSYGMNGFHIFDPATAGNGTYNSNLTYMSPGLLRYHSWEMMSSSSTKADGWIDTTNRRWDAAKVHNALTALTYNGATRMISIPGWPSWMDTNNDNFLDSDKFDAYAQFCADLVRIANINYTNHKITYWEITNERDDVYYVPFYNAGQPDRLNELIDIYNRAARAMKAVDGTIKTGGPAFARGDLYDQVRRFVQGTVNQTNPITLDYLSFHAYASGSASDSDEFVYNRAYNPTQTANSVTKHSKDIRDILSQESPNRRIPLWLDEYNISWTWQTYDARMKNHKGAVFDALILVKALESGVDATTAWNEKDGVYGKMGDDYVRRVTAETFQLFNKYLRGQRVSATTSTTTTSIVPMATIYNGKRAFVVINRSPVWQRIFVNFNGWTPSNTTYNRYRITSGGYISDTISHDMLINANNQQFWVDPDSVTVITTQ